MFPTAHFLPETIEVQLADGEFSRTGGEISENKNERNAYIKQGALRLRVRTSGSPLAQRSWWSYFLQKTQSKQMQ